MRFFVPQLPPESYVNLPEDEAKHALRVMRLSDGDQVELFDGRGNFAIGKLVDCSRNSAAVIVKEVQFADRTFRGLSLAIGLPKGDRQRSVIERATELGVEILQPLVCDFGVAEVTDKVLDRIKRTVIEACKQCERNLLMDVSDSQASSAFFASSFPANELRLLCHPRVSGAVCIDKTGLSQLGTRAWERICVAVGPEGGFSPTEVQQAFATGWLPLDLGERILRVETAMSTAITFASILKNQNRTA